MQTICDVSDLKTLDDVLARFPNSPETQIVIRELIKIRDAVGKLTARLDKIDYEAEEE